MRDIYMSVLNHEDVIMSQSPSDVKDYTENPEGPNSHYNGVPSWYGKIVAKQMAEQPQYCEPGEAGGGLQGEHRNVQQGP